MKTNYVLIDYENVQVKSLELVKGEQFRVRVFLGRTNTKLHRELVIAMQALGERASYVELETSGANALDFHIAFYLGEFATREPDAFFHIISRDTGFDPLIAHLKSRKINAARSASIEEMPCFVQKAATPAPENVLAKSGSANKQAKPNDAAVATALGDLVELVLKDLLARKSARPVKMKTLLNTIHGRIGKQRQLKDAEAVRDALVARKYVVPDGLKVSYQLPKAK